MDEMTTVTGFTETFLARTLCVGDFAGALCGGTRRLEGSGGTRVRPSPLAQVQAITYFARALGAARSGNPEAAKADIAKLAELRDRLREAKDAYWSEQVDIQRQVASAWVLYAEGKYDDALNAMSAAADAEDKTEKHPVTPGVPKPARELYGVMLLERGNAQGSARRLRSDAEEGAQSAWPLMRARQRPPKNPAIQQKLESIMAR